MEIFLSLATALGHSWPWWQTMMADVGVAHKLLKNKKKKKKIKRIQITDKATSMTKVSSWVSNLSKEWIWYAKSGISGPGVWSISPIKHIYKPCHCATLGYHILDKSA